MSHITNSYQQQQAHAFKVLTLTPEPALATGGWTPPGRGAEPSPSSTAHLTPAEHWSWLSCQHLCHVITLSLTFSFAQLDLHLGGHYLVGALLGKDGMSQVQLQTVLGVRSWQLGCHTQVGLTHLNLNRYNQSNGF